MQDSKDLFIFLDTKMLGNMYFGVPKATPMKAELQVRNDSSEIIKELRLSVKAIDMKSKSDIFLLI